MRFIEKLQLIERIDQLIKMKATGSARELAIRLNISKSTVYGLIEVMKAMDAEIDYCTARKSYYYVSNKILSIGFVNISKVRGGRNLSITSIIDNKLMVI